MAKKDVRVGKIDLDTVGTTFLLGVTREDAVIAVRGNATLEDLADPSVICIEVGGSGQVDQNNWDHHASDGPQDSATLQAMNQQRDANWVACSTDERESFEVEYSQLVEYIDLLDTQGPEALHHRTGGSVEFPTLSDVFVGLLLCERDPVEQLHKGIEFLQSVLTTGQNPFGTICGFESYAEAKRVNNAQMAEAVKSAQWATTQTGRKKLGFLETEFGGAPGALYGAGAEVVVAFNPTFGNPPVPKFTIAGNSVKVDSALPALNELEQGWGGPPTGTILGSPRAGSSLTLEQVVEIVKNAC